MRFDLNEDQQTFSGVLGQILGSPAGAFRAAVGWERFEYGASLDAQLEENGFYDLAAEDTLGPVMAAEMIMQIAALPVVVEAAASAMVLPFLGEDLPRPMAVIDGAPGPALRFATHAKSVLWLDGDKVQVALIRDGAATVADSLFAYPMGEIATDQLEWSVLEVDASEMRALLRVATAAELVGAMTGGLSAVLDHVRDRHQFGRPLGSFQGVQHRLANASVSIEAARLLTLKAAQSSSADDVSLAIAQAQRVSKAVVYDLHQFMGAMGLTLEHPLHRYTYRIRLLRAAFGGPSRAMAAYAEARWGA